VRVTFDAEGQVTSADVAEPSASTPEGACVLDVLRRVAFPAFGQARFSASYRYAVDEALATPTVVELRGRE